MIWRMALAAGTLMVAGCAMQPADAPEPAASPDDDRAVATEMDPLDRTDDTCGLNAAKPWLGRSADDIPPADLPERARIVSPDTNVTMDYVPQRLNILTDEAGMVIGLKCG